MSGFVKRTKAVDTANPAGGIDPAKTPNVGQYGWTSFDAGNVNQIIEYVDMCKKYAEEVSQSAEYIEGKIVELEAFMRYIENVYEELKPIYDDIIPIYHDIELRHEDIKVRHEDIITKHGEVEDWHYEVNIMTEETEANAAKALTSQLLAGQSEQGAEGWYDKSYELYEDLRKGNIYRGTWNPHTSAYPDNGGTNSTWDVILNEGETEFRWNNILWFWGDRLVYLKEDDMYQQIESGTTVTSVNGKKGAVVLSADDVKAVPVTRTVNGKALSANISITSTDTNSVPTTRRVNNKVLDSDVVLTHSDVQAVPLDRKVNNKFLSADITLTSADVKARPDTWTPTAADVGAAPDGYGLGGGPFVNRGDANRIFYNGWQDYNSDGGDTNGAESYGIILHSGNKGNGDVYSGWSSQFFQGTSGKLHYRNNKTGGSFNGTSWEQIYTSANNPLNDAGTYDGQPRDFNTLEPGFSGLIVIYGSSNTPPPSTWGDGHTYVEVKRVLGGEIVQRTLPFRNCETTASRVRQSNGAWTAWKSAYNSGYFPKISNWKNFGETAQNVVGGLTWSHFGNNHAIVDVSSGFSPEGKPVSPVDAGVPWKRGSLFPTLIGWNGSQTYGVRVDSARVADTVLDNGIVANGNGNAWSIVNGNIVEFGGFVGCNNAAPQRVDFPFPLGTVFTVQITPYTEGTGRGGTPEANNVVDILDNNGFTTHSGQGKTPCTFMWMAKGIRATTLEEETIDESILE